VAEAAALLITSSDAISLARSLASMAAPLALSRAESILS